MTRTLAVIGGKGGVGKTTLVSNLSTALSELGYEVTAIDANLTTPNLGLHLGMHLAPKTLHDVLKKKTKLRNSIYPHALGFKLIPASMSVTDLAGVDVGRLPEVTLSLVGKTDFVVMDCAAGLGREAVSAMEAADEILIITNPDLPSVADALKTIKIAQDLNKKITGVVVNKVNKKRHELTKSEVEEILGMPVLVEIPEDMEVEKSLAVKRPVVDFNPYSPASIEMKRLAHQLVGRPFKPKKRRTFRILDRLVGWMTG